MMTRLVALAAVATALATLGWAGSARADCEASIASLTKQMQSVTDNQARTQIFLALHKARQEIGELDEDECLAAVDTATKLLQSQKVSASGGETPKKNDQATH